MSDLSKVVETLKDNGIEVLEIREKLQRIKVRREDLESASEIKREVTNEDILVFSDSNIRINACTGGLRLRK